MIVVGILAGMGFVLSIFLGIISIIAYKREKRYKFLLSAIMFFIFNIKFLVYLVLEFQYYEALYFILDVIILIIIYFSLVGKARREQ